MVSYLKAFTPGLHGAGRRKGVQCAGVRMPWERAQHGARTAGPPLSGHRATAWSMTFWEGRPSVTGVAAHRGSAQLCTALQTGERWSPVWGHDPMTQRCALPTATPSWQVAAWLGHRARPEGEPGLPNTVRAYLSPACRQYATMMSRVGRVGQSRGVASESLQPGPAAGRSGRRSTGKGGVRAANHRLIPPSPQPGANGRAGAARSLAERPPETTVARADTWESEAASSRSPSQVRWQRAGPSPWGRTEAAQLRFSH